MKDTQPNSSYLPKQELSKQQKRVKGEIFLRKFALKLEKDLGRKIEKEEFHRILNQYLANEAEKRKR